MISPYDIAKKISESAGLKKNFIAPKSFTGAYITYRVLRPLLKLNYKIFKLFHPERPWTTQTSIRIFEKILTREMIGLEYGSGNSTIFFASHLKHLTSVEHNKEWFSIVTDKLKARNLNNIDYHFIPPSGDHQNEVYRFYQDFPLTESDFQIRREYHDYFSFVTKFPDHHFDFILVDGRARVECCLNAIPKLRSGGFFVLDNSDRQRYVPVFKVLSGWPSITTTTGLFDTTIWFKP